jgi:hypothetical protein
MKLTSIAAILFSLAICTAAKFCPYLFPKIFFGPAPIPDAHLEE